MDVSSINSDLIRGNVTTIILKALLDEDRYGYDILREIEVKSGGQYKLCLLYTSPSPRDCS